MGKTRKDDKSDDIEILSIGKLYNGAWDKKYWSSSRGKDRYPYPVGYKSLRTQNGITYTMEILEGLKGPSFKISSTDGKLFIGGTPEIAWESFQKKGSSKALHTKRFSCKKDAVEFFGFKNTFVQRLLRELAANAGGTAEQILVTSNFSAGARETNYQLQGKPLDPDPDPVTCLFKSHAKGKRSRNNHAASRKRLNETRFKLLQQEERTKNVSSSISKQSNQSNSLCSDLSTFAVEGEVPVTTPGSLGPEICHPVTEEGVGLNSFDIHVGEPLCEGKELTSSENHIELNTDSLHRQQECGDRLSYFVVQNNILPEDGDGATNVQHDIPVASNADLFVADTFDHSGDSSSVSSQNEDVNKHSTEIDAVIKDTKMSEVQVTDSLPEDVTVKDSGSTNSETCDTDSVGDDVVKSMMAIILPRAIPLLKTFSRKKKKRPKSSDAQRSLENNDINCIRTNNLTTARELAEHSDLPSKNGEPITTCADPDSAVRTSGNFDYVVPDSFDNYSTQELLHHADVARSGQLSHVLHPPAQLPINGDTKANTLPCQSGSSKHDTGTADLTSMAVADAVSPLNEFTTNSKRARLDYCSIDNIVQTKDLIQLGSVMNEVDCDSTSSNLQIPTKSCSNLAGDIKTKYDSRSNMQHGLKLNGKQPGHLLLFACYTHPIPILTVQLIVRENEIFTCVKCGYLEHNYNNLFVYKASMKGEKLESPSLVGHAPITLQITKNTLGRDISSERSLLQLTPDGESLALLNSIRIPHCREGKLHCSCSPCTSNGFEKNTVKIVRLHRGYASLVTILKTVQGVSCLLVCKPSFLLAAEEGGMLKLWVMNSEWSGHNEDCYLPTSDCMFPCMVELKTVPNSAGLVIGHNGFGEFGIWDIDKRSLVSRFSSTGMSVLECIPISIFSWQMKEEYNRTGALVADIMDATTKWSSKTSDNHVVSPEDKDVAAWLLISTTSDLDHDAYQSSEQEETAAIRCWRLALLVKNTVITGSILDEGAVAVTASGRGIMGRHDGEVYMWEISTGKKLGNLQTFKGSRISCIASDSSNSGALAIASEAQLRVYLPS